MRKINVPLILGLIIFILLITVSSFPGLFTKVDPYAVEGVITGHDGKIYAAPHPPGILGLLGTDELGRDIFSQVVYGTRVTLKIVLFAVSMLFLLAFPLGLRAGFGKNTSRWILNVLNTVFNVVPALIFCAVITSIPALKQMTVETSVYIFAAVIALVELGRFGTQVQKNVENILHEPFIEGVIAVGKNRVQIAFQNVIPHLIPSLLVFLSLEAARVLFLMCQLGVLNIFIGNLNFDADTAGMLGRRFSYEPEWAGMLGSGVKRFTTYPWIVFPAVAAFFTAILGFNMLGEGLKTEFQKENSYFITWLKKIPYYLSPRMFIYDIKRIPSRALPGLIKLIFVTSLIAFVLFSKYLFSISIHMDRVHDHVQKLVQAKDEDKKQGNNNNHLLADIISSKLRDAGLKAAFNGGYIQEFTVERPPQPLEQNLTIRLDDQETLELKPYEDYAVMNRFDTSVKIKFDMSHPQGEIYITSSGDVSKQKLENELGKLSGDPYCKAILVITGWRIQPLDELIEIEHLNVPILQVNRKIGDKIMSHKKLELSFSAKMIDREPIIGKNVFGFLPGTEKNMEDQYIVVGTTYGDISNPKESPKISSPDTLPTVGLSLEISKALAHKGLPKKKIIFAFWGDSGGIAGDARNTAVFEGPKGTWNSLYLDLRYLGTRNGRDIIFDDTRNSFQMLDCQRMARYLKNEFRRTGLNLIQKNIFSFEAEIMRYNGLGTLAIEPDGLDGSTGSENGNHTQVDYSQLKKLGQGIANALVKMAY